MLNMKWSTWCIFTLLLWRINCEENSTSNSDSSGDLSTWEMILDYLASAIRLLLSQNIEQQSMASNRGKSKENVKDLACENTECNKCEKPPCEEEDLTSKYKLG